LKALVTGVTGQVGRALLRSLEGRFEVIPADRRLLDLASKDAIVAAVRGVAPRVILNPAAFTSVDVAEQQPELAFKVNAEAPGILAEEAKRIGALLVHYSTDYVFDGALRRPYIETDPTGPLSTYARSKLEGERRVRESGCAHMVLRTSWVYGGEKTFAAAILDKARRNEKLRVVSDQTGAPTWAADVADLTAALLSGRHRPEGVWHAAAAGEVTRYDYAVRLLQLAGLDAIIEPIATSDFPSSARRPPYSALDSRALRRASGVPAIGGWDERLKRYLESAR